MKKSLIAYTLITLMLSGIYKFCKPLWHPYYNQIRGRKTVSEVISKIEPNSESKLKKLFFKNNLDYPPEGLKLVGLKEEELLQVYALYNGLYSHVYDISVLAASGKAGPKLKEGDRQVPEGIYKTIGLNPNSSYHLSIKLNYPNELDKKIAKEQRRKNLGGNIFIHGKNASIGCLALGDTEIEKLFTLIHKVGKTNVSVVIAPYDFRKKDLPINSESWVNDLYEAIKVELP